MISLISLRERVESPSTSLLLGNLIATSVMVASLTRRGLPQLTAKSLYSIDPRRSTKNSRIPLRNIRPQLMELMLCPLAIHRYSTQPVIVKLFDGMKKDAWSDLGTPQGGSVSPLLANVYLHYAFDVWM